MIKYISVDGKFTSLNDLINEYVKEIELENGVVRIQSLSKTTAIVSNSNEESGILDLIDTLHNVVPARMEYKSNEDPKLTSSLAKSTLLGYLFEVVVREGVVNLSKDQNIYALNTYGEQSEIILDIL